MPAQSSFLQTAEKSQLTSWSKSKVLFTAGAVIAAAGSYYYFSTRILPWLRLKSGQVVHVTAGSLKGKQGICYGVNADGFVRVLLDGGKCIICISKNSLQVTAAHVDPAARSRELEMELAATPPQGQLRIVVAGLMGSGKSTLCRMLAHLLGGVWINQDEFSSKGKGAKKAFLAEIKRVAADATIPVLIVDKINTMRQHRADILQSMQSDIHGNVVFFQLTHPKDVAGSFKNQTKVCRARIQGRGGNHRTLMGNDPKLQSILNMTVKGVEPMDEHEVNRFSGVFAVDMTLPPKQALMIMLCELGNSGFLRCFDVESLTMQNRLGEAFSVTQAAELNLKGEAVPPQAKEDKEQPDLSDKKKKKKKGEEVPPQAKEDKEEPDPSDKKKKKKSKQNKEPSDIGGEQAGAAEKAKQKQSSKVLLWAIDLDSDSEDGIRKLSSLWASSAPNLQLQSEFHCTLLFMGGSSDEKIASQQWHIQESTEVTRLREMLEAREGEEVELQLSCIAWDDRIAAASVHGLEDMCLNKYAHITLARRDDTPPVKSNELLARKAAQLDLVSGLGPWLQQLGLQKHHDAIKGWCERSGVRTEDNIAKCALEIAESLENESKDEQARVHEVLTKAATGEIRETSVDIRVRGKVSGWRTFKK